MAVTSQTVYKATAECLPSREGGDAYILNIVPTIESSLAAITSANELLILSRENLSTSAVLRLKNIPQKVSCLVTAGDAGDAVVCGGDDGVVATYDVRSQHQISSFKIDRAVTALACRGDNVAVGTELAHHQAVVTVWDRRQNKSFWQNAENNDDITALEFHPSKANILLCGGDDGQVSIFDTSIAEEDDSLIQGVNHGPIHKAGFVGGDRLFALSSDQNLTIYPLSSPGDEEDPPPSVLGDLRPLLHCEYVIDCFRSGDGYAIAAGTNIKEQKVQIAELRHALDPSRSPKLETDAAYVLEGAHGEEVVRSIFVDETSGTIFTAGEDGYVRAFQKQNEELLPATSKTSKIKKGADSRYKPY